MQARLSTIAGFLIVTSSVQAQTASTEPSPQSAPQSVSDAAAIYRKMMDAQMRVDWANLSKYRSRDARLKKPVPGESRVVFLGDSITENWTRIYNPGVPVPGDFFPGLPYENRGISGQTSPQMLVRFRQDVIALQPKVVVILAGTNDIAQNTGPMELADTESNLQSMSDLAIANGIKVVLCSVPPTNSFPLRPDIVPGQKIIDLNRWIREYAALKGFPYVDYYSVLVAASGGMRPEYTKDGLHPNRAAYALMAPLVQTAIDEALGQKAARESDHSR